MHHGFPLSKLKHLHDQYSRWQDVFLMSFKVYGRRNACISRQMDILLNSCSLHGALSVTFYLHASEESAQFSAAYTSWDLMVQPMCKSTILISESVQQM